jgi:hypothetical protein
MNNYEMYLANDPMDYLRRDIVRVAWHIDCYDWDIPEMVATYADKFGNDERYEAMRIFEIHNYIDLQDEALDAFKERIEEQAKAYLETKGTK